MPDPNPAILDPAAYAAGYAAGTRDDTTNPYPAGTVSRVMWRLGWNTAIMEKVAIADEE